MPVAGGAAVVVTSASAPRDRRCWCAVAAAPRFQTPDYARDLLRTPIAAAAAWPSRWRPVPGEVVVVSIYDCYTITVLMTLEDAGFCARVRSALNLGHDLATAAACNPRRPALFRPDRHGREACHVIDARESCAAPAQPVRDYSAPW
jgi:hypothetical protein